MQSAPVSEPITDWSSFITGMEPVHRWLLLVIAIGCLVTLVISLVAIISSTIRSTQRHRAEVELKRDMIERGMSADEIAKVVEAAAPPEDATERLIASWAKPKTPS